MEKAKQARKAVRRSYEDSRKYLKTWEKEFPWVTSVLSEGSEQAFCKLCRKTLQTHRGTLVKHEQGAQHRKITSSVSISNTLNFPKKIKVSPVSDSVKRAELELAVTMCCHCSIQTIDHLGEVIKNGKGSTLENIRLHRTKCTTLISSVLSPSLKAELKNDIKGKRFSLMLDETTDITLEKLLATCVRYYSENTEKIMTAFLGLYPIVQATGEALFQTVKDSLYEYDLTLANCIGIACDGAAVMVGENNSVWSRIKEDSPNCILNKCVCHSLALCVQKAFETLPSNLGYLFTEIPGWFCNSTLRRHNYKKLFEEMNEDNHERECSVSNKNTVNMPFLKLSGTRWLVRGRVIKRLIENWNELKCYFRLAMQEGTQEVRFKAKVIYEMLNDDTNYLYMVFLSPFVSEFENVNAFFQSTNSDPEAMYKELDILFRGLKSRVFNNHGEKLTITMTDFGTHFMNELTRCTREKESNKAFYNAVTGLKKRCQEFIFDLIKEVEKRLPANKHIFQGLSGLHPSKVLSQTARFPFSQLPLHHLLEKNLDSYEQQYRKIVLHIWSEESVFENGIPDDSQAFWAGIYKYENSLGDKPYKEIALYALACLSCPVSNAVVERVFSIVTCVKTKYRNQMCVKVLDSIVRVRTNLMMKGICCINFEITDDMLQRFKSDMYHNDESSE